MLMALLLMGSFAVHAQVQVPGCPPGVVPGQPGCGGSDGDSSSASTYTGPIWQDRFGAIAESESTPAAGVAQNSNSKRAAREEALQDCGKSDCKITHEVRNSCIAIAWGGGVGGYATKADLHAAEAVAIDSCKGAGGGGCKIQYSACSLPVRIR